jgi:phage terminase small subunit
VAKQLNPKQKRFCEEYLKDLNSSQAAIRAGYSEKTAGQIGHELLKKPEAAMYIAALKNQRSNRTQISADRVLEELSNIAFANIVDIVTADRDGLVIRDIENLTKEQQVAIAESGSVTTVGMHGNSNTSVKTKMHDKLGALKLLCQHLGVTSDFNIAIHTLAKYGLHLKRDKEGEWYVSTTAPAAADE